MLCATSSVFAHTVLAKSSSLCHDQDLPFHFSLFIYVIQWVLFHHFTLSFFQQLRYAGGDERVFLLQDWRNFLFQHCWARTLLKQLTLFLLHHRHHHHHLHHLDEMQAQLINEYINTNSRWQTLVLLLIITFGVGFHALYDFCCNIRP